MKGREIFAILFITILLFNCASAGLLQTIRDAAFLKEDSPTREHRAVSAELPPFSNIPQDDETSFFDQYHSPSSRENQSPTNPPRLLPPPCGPGDFLCLAQRNMKNTLGSEMSNAIIKTVATLMTEMLNTTISRSLDIMHQAQGSNDPGYKEDQARAAMSMVGTALSNVSSKVINGMASFVKVSLSGAMWDMFNQVVNAASRGSSTSSRGAGGIFSGGVGAGKARALGDQDPQGLRQQTPTEQKTVVPVSDQALVSPSNMYIPTQTNNEIKRSGLDVATDE